LHLHTRPEYFLRQFLDIAPGARFQKSSKVVTGENSTSCRPRESVLFYGDVGQHFRITHEDKVGATNGGRD
jgi:hypothetical protein